MIYLSDLSLCLLLMCNVLLIVRLTVGFLSRSFSSFIRFSFDYVIVLWRVFIVIGAVIFQFILMFLIVLDFILILTQDSG